MEHPPGPRINAHHHAVQFYGNEQSLYTTVGGFLSEGLVSGQPAIIVATEAHRLAIVAELSARFIDVVKAQEIGDLVLLDAEEAMSVFMVNGEPNAEAFEDHFGGVMTRMLNGRTRTVVRAYGEMVDLLWKEGRTSAAIKLEIMWNKLATAYQFALLCGYSMGNFYKQAEQFQQICEQHTHVLDMDSNVVVLEPKRAKRA